jgi:hypothetical protein
MPLAGVALYRTWQSVIDAAQQHHSTAHHHLDARQNQPRLFTLTIPLSILGLCDFPLLRQHPFRRLACVFPRNSIHSQSSNPGSPPRLSRPQVTSGTPDRNDVHINQLLSDIRIAHSTTPRHRSTRPTARIGRVLPPCRPPVPCRSAPSPARSTLRYH